MGDTIYELDVYPITIYIQKLANNGTKPYNDFVTEGKLDFEKVKKSKKLMSHPFTEFTITKKATFDQLFRLIQGKFKLQGSKRSRILYQDTIISGMKMSHSLEDHQISTGSVIYIESLNQNNTWPSDTKTHTQA